MLLHAAHFDHRNSRYDGFRHCGSRDETFLICLLISKDHVFKGMRDSIGVSTSLYFISLPRVMAKSLMVAEM